MDADGGFSMLPLCRFRLHNLDHTMQFLAFVEAIEQWAELFLLPNVRSALQTINAHWINVTKDEEGEEETTEMTFLLSSDPDEKSLYLTDDASSPGISATDSKRLHSVNFGISTSITNSMRSSTPQNTAEKISRSKMNPDFRLNYRGRYDQKSDMRSNASMVSSLSAKRLNTAISTSQKSSDSSQRAVASPLKTRFSPRQCSSCMRYAQSPALKTIASESPESLCRVSSPEEPTASMVGSVQLK